MERECLEFVQMSRLTISTRDAIRASALVFAFNPKWEALRQAEYLLAREAHAFLFKKEHLALAAKLPLVWVPKISKLKLNVGGQKIELDIDEPLHVPYSGQSGHVESYGYITGAIPFGDLCDRIQAHAHAIEMHKEDRRQASMRLEAMLASYTTINKLADEWPDGKQFYEKYMEKPAPQVPAVRVDEINSMLGLPEGAAA